MNPIDRPNDDVRERLTLAQIHSICEDNGLPVPTTVEPEPRGNEKVIYHLDGRYSLQFLVSQQDVDPLRVLNQIDEIPSPEILAWREDDSDANNSYLITTKCPGSRFDLLWHTANEDQRSRMLYGLGEGLAGYHSLSPDTVIATAGSVGLATLIRDDRKEEWTWQKRWRNLTVTAMPAIEALLQAVSEEPDALVRAIHSHLESTEVPSLGPAGLTHSEPWAEHYILNAQDDRYVLTGCIDIERISIADPAHELAVMAASVLAHDTRWLNAFAEGYRTHRDMPDNLEQRIHHLAMEHDLWSLSSSAGKAQWFNGELVEDGKPLSRWRIHCATGHARRLRKWLGLTNDFDEYLFRAEIGPW